jgi:hypothetical protein
MVDELKTGIPYFFVQYSIRQECHVRLNPDEQYNLKFAVL